MPSFVK